MKRAVSCRMEVLLDRVRLQRLGLLLVILSMAGFAACYTRKAYRGDGKIFAVKVGNFFLGCTWYKVSLGPIDLATKNTKVFTMQGLPHKEMCLGFQTSLSDRTARIQENKCDALVLVKLVDETGRSVIHDTVRLDTWTWEYDAAERYKSFVYWGGHHSAEGPQISRIDDGDGTYFKPRTKAKYTLTIEIVEPDSKGRNYNAELEIEGLCF